MTQKHNPTQSIPLLPWRTKTPDAFGECWIVDANGWNVALFDSKDVVNNAGRSAETGAMIVRAVNAHDALVSALQRMLDESEPVHHSNPFYYARAEAFSALRAARGEA